MKVKKRAACGLVLASLALAQNTNPSFEVASVKPAAPSSDESLSVSMSRDPGRISYTNATLKSLIAHAYQVKEHQVSGPDWIDSERFDVNAKIADGISIQQVPSMLQGLLAERFKLRLHRTTKVRPVYVLTISKSGPKLHKTNEEPGVLRMAITSEGRHVSGKVSLETFSHSLSAWLDRPVVDMTGLKGIYDLDVKWSGDEGPSDLRVSRTRPDASQTGSTEDGDAGLPLAASIQKRLGLRLESRKAPVEVWVVEHAERVPAVN